MYMYISQFTMTNFNDTPTYQWMVAVRMADGVGHVHLLHAGGAGQKGGDGCDHRQRWWWLYLSQHDMRDL